MSKFALVSTFDSIENMPHHFVVLFDTEDQAEAYALQLILKYTNDMEYDAENGVWKYDDDEYELAHQALEAWQFDLGNLEYFHVFPVLDQEEVEGDDPS